MTRSWPAATSLNFSVITARLISATVNFTINRRVVFKGNESLWKALVKYAAQINGLDCIALTRLDILDSFSEIKLCVAYKLDGKILDEFPASLNLLAKVEPVYETFPGWLAKTSDIKDYKDLPANCRRYVERLAEVVGTRIGMVSVGPERERTILCEKMF